MFVGANVGVLHYVFEWINKFYSDHSCSISKHLDEYKRTRDNALRREQADAERAKRDRDTAKLNRKQSEAYVKRVKLLRHV
jgi:hypothetical protein